MTGSRRAFLKATAGLGPFALASLLGRPAAAAKAKRAIWLFMGGGPSQLDLFDYKPGLAKMFDQDLPPSVRGTQRLTTMTAQQARFPIAPSLFPFAQHGGAGTWVSALLPKIASMVDDLALVRTVQTDAINHEPATLFANTGSELPGKPSVGAWLSYGLGTLNQNLPTFVVMTSRFPSGTNAQALSARLWGSGMLPAQLAGVAVRGAGEPVLYLQDPPGVDRSARRLMLDGVKALNDLRQNKLSEPEIGARTEQYEMAFRLQSAVPELTDLSKETEATYALYGDDVHTPGSFAANCLLARRMVERGVRFVQIYHRGWDSHFNLPADHPRLCQDIDQGCFGLVQDLKARGLLDDTLVVWGGEFGRTVYSQGTLTSTNYGRDHHPKCFTMWLGGAGVKPGTVYGETDDFSYNVARDPVHLRDLHATLLDQFGLDAQQLGVSHQGLFERLIATGHTGTVVRGILR
jgi:uncharacterized protein (DUF1501 family)